MKKKLLDSLFDIGLATLIIGISLFAGFWIGVGWMQTKAAESGAGHYVVNPTNGVTQFQFKK